MRNKLILIFLLIIISVTLTSCYDNDEIDSLANVVALGIEEGGYTFALADTGSFSGEGNDGSKSATLCHFVEADSIENAIDEANRRMSKKLSFSHMSVILISPFEAKDGIYATANYLDGMPEVRPQTLIAITDINPSEYLEKLKPLLEVNPEKYFLNMFQKSSSYIPVLRLSEYTDSVKNSKDILAPVINASSQEDETTEENSFVAGTVLLRDGRLAYAVKDIAAVGLLNSTKNVQIKSDGRNCILYSKEKAKIIPKKDRVIIKLKLGSKNDRVKDASEIKRRVETALYTSAKAGYDIFGFSDEVKEIFRFQKNYDRYDLRRALKNLKFDVKVESK